MDNLPNDKEISEKFKGYIDQYFELVLPEIEKIQQYAKKAGINPNIIHAVSQYNKDFMEGLLKLKTELGLGPHAHPGLGEINPESASMLLYHLRQIRESIIGSFSCAVAKRAEDLINIVQNIDTTIDLKIDIQRDSLGIIRPSDFSQIMQNLLKNALTAVENSQSKKVKVGLTETLDYIFINVSDTGTGISPEIKEQLFKEQTSSKANGGGFGLYYSQNLLQKYGGKIKIKNSIIGQGTEIELQLKRV